MSKAAPKGFKCKNGLHDGETKQEIDLIGLAYRSIGVLAVGFEIYMIYALYKDYGKLYTVYNAFLMISIISTLALMIFNVKTKHTARCEYDSKYPELSTKIDKKVRYHNLYNFAWSAIVNVSLIIVYALMYHKGHNKDDL